MLLKAVVSFRNIHRSSNNQKEGVYMNNNKWLPFVVGGSILLAGCGQVMDSTANLLNTAAERIEKTDEEIEQPPAVDVVEQPEGVVTEMIEPATATPQPAKQPAAPKKEEAVVEQHDTVMDSVVITAEQGNVRAQPSIDAKVVASGEGYTYYEYLREKVKTADGRTWYKVDYGSGTGYISSAVAELTIFGDAPLMPGLEAVVISEANGNVRIEPYINSDVMYTAKKGTRLEATGAFFESADGRTWYSVHVNGKVGYISDRVVSEVYDEESFAYEDRAAQQDVFYVTNAEGNVRADVSLTSNIIYTAKKGASLAYMGTYEKTADGRTWYKVEVNGQYGYISGAVGELK